MVIKVFEKSVLKGKRMEVREWQKRFWSLFPFINNVIFVGKYSNKKILFIILI